MINHIILIQKYIRGFLVRLSLKKLKDGMTLDILKKLLDNYKNTILFEKNINKLLTKKKIRISNFPSHISENIVKYAIFKKYNIMPSWDTQNGDLEIKYNSFNLKLEVKAGLNISYGPSSFGPCEKWNKIYFLDAKKILFNKFLVYEININNNDNIWQNLKFNKFETYKDQIKQKRRPRICFDKILEQIPKYKWRIIFNDDFDQLY